MTINRLALLAVLTLAMLTGLWLLLDMPQSASNAALQREQLATQQLGPKRPVGAESAKVALDPQRQNPMYLLATVEGLAYCAEGESRAEVFDNPSLEAYCQAHDLDNASKLAQMLDRLEPGGPGGQVQVGYVITTKLLSLYRQTADGWQFDASNFARELRLIEKVDRPVALYLSSTHFDSLGALPEQLAQDGTNLALFPDQQPTTLSYFSYPIIPYTLNPDPALDVNHYKRQALERIHAMLAEMAPEHRARIVAIFLGGEAHHFYQGFEDGMGEYLQPAVTDYSAQSQQAFRGWLTEQYGSVAALNAAYGSDFAAFDSITAPSGNFRLDASTPALQHYDGYSQGTLPVHGWFWDPKGETDALRVYVDGAPIADAARGFNRLDVYRAVSDVDTPSTGFRLDLPFDQLPPGKHMISVTYQLGRYECLLDERVIEVLGHGDEALDFTDQHRVFTSLREANLPCPRRARLGKRFYLDSPQWETQVAFNPLARDWNAFRQAQVVSYMQALYNTAVDIGYPAKLLFSHQILPEVNSSWNPNLFASQTSVAAGTDWKPGFNLYGGAVWSDWTAALLADLAAGESGYGVPEFHPQQWKSPQVAYDAMVAHYNAGAHFLSPYYFAVTPERHLQPPESNAVARMRLEPTNANDGSNLFYEAIRKLARE